MEGNRGNLVLSDENLKEFKQDYLKYGRYDYEKQVPHLRSLADSYFNRYKSSNNWTDALRAHSLYNAIGARKSLTNTEVCGKDVAVWRKEAFKVQIAYWKDTQSVSFEEQERTTKELWNQLTEIRNTTRTNLESVTSLAEQLDPDERSTGRWEQTRIFSREVKAISTHCTQAMIDLVKSVIDKSIQALSPQEPPCSFAVVALGSIARGEATPYSDLEYIFLVEEKGETISYFENLAMTSYFIIGNLGGTKLGCMSIPELNRWFEDTCASGFKIDGLAEKAGNIPTGNGMNHSDKNKFILTPNELLSRYKEVLVKPQEDSLQGDLTAMLTYTKVVFSHGAKGETLLTQFTEKIMNLELNTERNQMNMQMLTKDIKRHSLKPSQFQGKGGSLDVKKELYRFPSILLLDLAIIFNMAGGDSWKTLSLLQQKRKISKTMNQLLEFLLACACYIRLSAYLEHDSQDGPVSMLTKWESDEPKKKRLKLDVSRSGRRWYIPQKLFYTFCEISSQLQSNSTTSGDSWIAAFCLETKLKPLTWLSQLNIHYCCQRWDKALELFRQQHMNNSDELPSQEEAYKLLQKVLKDAGEVNEYMLKIGKVLRRYAVPENSYLGRALEYSSAVQNYLGHKIHRESDILLLIQTHILSAYCYEISGKRVEQMKEYEKIKSIEAKLTAKEKRDSNTYYAMASAYEAMGTCCIRTGKYGEAEQHLQTALEMFINIDQSEGLVQIEISKGTELAKFSAAERLPQITNQSLEISGCLFSLGCLYWEKKQLIDQQYLERALAMHQDFYGQSTNHPNIANILSTLAGNYWSRKKLDDAVKACKRSINMFEQLQKEGTEVKLRGLANAENTYGCALTKQGESSEAHKHITKAIKIFDKIGAIFHKGCTLDSLGVNFASQNKHEEAEKCFVQSMEIFEDKNVNMKESVNYGEAAKHLAETSIALNRFDTALKNYHKALPIFEKSFGKDDADTKHVRDSIVETERLLRVNE